MEAQLHPLAIGRRALADHAPVAGEGAVELVRELAAPLEGARVVHVSTASPRGRTAELLHAMLPLLRDAGLDPAWRVLFGDSAFRRLGGSLHDAMQGAESALAELERNGYGSACESAMAGLHGDWDAVVVHDPQLLPALAAAADRAPAVWRCHMDASEPDAEAWSWLGPFAEGCGTRVYPLEGFAAPGAAAHRTISPAIDPLGPGNVDVPVQLAGRIVRAQGVDLDRPFVAQVTRIDAWKDPHSVIDAWSMAREEVRGLQLVLAGAPAPDDAEGWHTFNELTDYAEGEADLHVITQYTGAGSVELGALRRLARAAVQKSLREGFGLAVAEALWKETPVIAGAVGGVTEQVRDGVEGFLTVDEEETADCIVQLVMDPGLAVEMGSAGRARVRDRFLVTRLVADELRLLQSVTAPEGATFGRQ